MVVRQASVEQGNPDKRGAEASDVPKPSEFQRAAAEFFGTFFLTLVAAGGDILDVRTNGTAIGHTARYLAPGFLVAAIIWSISAVSGAHINPAVTLTFVLRRCFPVARAALYWAAQFAGAIVAAALLRTYFGPGIGQGAPSPGLGFTPVAAMLWEAVLTFLLVFVILGTAEQEAVVGKNAALAVGLTVALCGLFSSPISGASMNPARAFGPQLVSGSMGYSWVYFVGPVIGAAAAAAVVYLIHGPPRESERDAAHGKHQ